MRLEKPHSLSYQEQTLTSLPPETLVSGESTVAPDYTVVDIGASYKISPAFTFHAGVQNLLDKRLNYDTAAYMIDPARLWMGVGVRF